MLDISHSFSFLQQLCLWGGSSNSMGTVDCYENNFPVFEGSLILRHQFISNSLKGTVETLHVWFLLDQKALFSVLLESSTVFAEKKDGVWDKCLWRNNSSWDHQTWICMNEEGSSIFLPKPTKIGLCIISLFVQGDVSNNLPNFSKGQAVQVFIRQVSASGMFKNNSEDQSKQRRTSHKHSFSLKNIGATQWC